METNLQLAADVVVVVVVIVVIIVVVAAAEFVRFHSPFTYLSSTSDL